jgi:DNA-binding transcriptional LysR family regulator
MQLAADLVVFAKVVELGGFSGAAKALGQSKSQVSKQVARLERALGATLLHRTTRRMALSQAGESLLHHADAIARSTLDARDAVAEHASAPTGKVRLTTSVAYGRSVLSKAVAAFLRERPGIQIELLLVDRFIDLIEEGVDLAVRLTDAPSQGLAGRRLHPITFHACATPDYAAFKGLAHPRDLSSCSCVSFSPIARLDSSAWSFQRGQERIIVDIKPVAAANSSDALRELVLEGLGVGVLPDFVAQHEIQQGRLVPLFPDWRVRGGFGSTAWLLWQPQRRLPPSVRALVDHLVTWSGQGQS